MLISENKFCACGCGGLVKPGNKFLPGHNSKCKNRLNPNRHTFETRICACGCGGTFECCILSPKKYIKQHHPSRYKPENHTLETRNCGCGCGETFECLVSSQKKYIKNHKLKNENKTNWKTNNIFELYSVDWTQTLKRSIRERDHYTCQLCTTQQGDRALSVHHIDYNKKNCNPTNLITLCAGCHSKINSNKEFYIKHFKALIELKSQAIVYSTYL